MNDNMTFTHTSKENTTEKEKVRQEGTKGGESWFTTWYEFESDRKDTDEDEHL